MERGHDAALDGDLSLEIAPHHLTDSYAGERHRALGAEPTAQRGKERSESRERHENDQHEADRAFVRARLVSSGWSMVEASWIIVRISARMELQAGCQVGSSSNIALCSYFWVFSGSCRVTAGHLPEETGRVSGQGRSFARRSRLNSE